MKYIILCPKIWDAPKRSKKNTIQEPQNKIDLKYNTLDAALKNESDTYIRGLKDFLFSPESYDALEKTTRQLLHYKLRILSPEKKP